MNHTKTRCNLIKHISRIIFRESSSLFQKMVQVTSIAVLHYHVKVVRSLRQIMELNDIGTVAQLRLLENIYFFLKLINQTFWMNYFLGHYFTCKKWITFFGKTDVTVLTLSEMLLRDDVIINLLYTDFVGFLWLMLLHFILFGFS